MLETLMSFRYGSYFRHKDLEGGGVLGLYREDGIHLSNIGLDILTLDLQIAIEQATGWGL